MNTAQASTKPDRARFIEARRFIEADITREIQFARQNGKGELLRHPLI